MNNTLVANERKQFRKSALHQIRKEGSIPAVVYGKHEESKSIVVKDMDLKKVIRKVGRNGVISLDVNGNSQNVLLKDFQVDPLSQNILHADFLHVTKSTEVHTKVYVELVGISKGVEEGGILQQYLHELTIVAKPEEIPEAIEIDISKLEINHSIKVGAIRKNYSNITINDDDEEVIVTITAPKLEEEETDISELQSEN